MTEPWVKTYSGGKPNYTEPKEWVGLTDKERAETWNESDPYDDINDFARAIEAKLKEKNSTTEKNIQISDNND
jgi:hypothetical protein